MAVNFKFSDFSIIVLLSLVIVFETFLFSSFMLVYNVDFYKHEAVKNGVYDGFKNNTYVDSAYTNLVEYFNNGNLIDIYDPDEARHLDDVKLLIDKLTILFYSVLFILILILFILWFNDYRYLWLVFITTFVFIIFISLSVYLFSLFNFMYLFNSFHEVFFMQGSWIFNNNSTLINLFPIKLFADAFKKIIIYSNLISLFILCIGLHIRKFN